MKPRLLLVQTVLVVAIFVQAFAIITLYEGATGHKQEAATFPDAEELGKAADTEGALSPELSKESLEEGLARIPAAHDADKQLGVVRHTTPNPGGLILSSTFSYMQDPREVHRKKPLPRILPTYENLYHFQTTVHEQRLHAIIFHDDISFNETFVKKHTSEYIKFVRVEAPTFNNGEPVIAPNDFRFLIFDKWLKANSKQDEKGQVLVNGINYGWILISDMDMMFQRNPFPKLDDYAKRQNLTFFGSWDGGNWGDEQMRLQRRLFRNCYGRKLLMSWSEDLEFQTQNGNCGLWAGQFFEVSCILNCMASQYNKPPVQGKGSSTICDMAVHDYCVHYGGCFPGSKFGIYDEKKVGVLWGESTMGQNNNLFGPPYGRYRQCDKDNWTVLHNRCDWKGPLCYRRDKNGELVKYHQSTRGRKCKLDPNTDLPLSDSELKEAEEREEKDKLSRNMSAS